MSDYSATAAEVKALRDATGAGIMECKNALRESAGDHDAAVKLLRERGIAKSGKRADRTTTEGLIEAYVHGGRIGVLVEIGCETDFVAGTDEFKAFAFKGNVVDLAIAVIIGGVFHNLIDSLVKNLIMPLIAILIPGQRPYTHWQITVRGSTIHIGLLLGDTAATVVGRGGTHASDLTGFTARPNGSQARQRPRHRIR